MQDYRPDPKPEKGMSVFTMLLVLAYAQGLVLLNLWLCKAIIWTWASLLGSSR